MIINKICGLKQTTVISQSNNQSLFAFHSVENSEGGGERLSLGVGEIVNSSHVDAKMPPWFNSHQATLGLLWHSGNPLSHPRFQHENTLESQRRGEVTSCIALFSFPPFARVPPIHNYFVTRRFILIVSTYIYNISQNLHSHIVERNSWIKFYWIFYFHEILSSQISRRI